MISDSSTTSGVTCRGLVQDGPAATIAEARKERATEDSN